MASPTLGGGSGAKQSSGNFGWLSGGRAACLYLKEASLF